MMAGPVRNFGASFLHRKAVVVGGLALLVFVYKYSEVLVRASDTVEKCQLQQRDDIIIVNYTDNIAPSSPLGLQRTVPLVNKKSSAGQERIAILHVGPHKTGSTLLQEQLIRLEELLHMDGYAMPMIKGKFGQHKATANLAFSLQGDFSYIDQATWPYFMEFMDQTKQDGMNVILSSEEFDRETVDLESLKRMLKSWDQTRVVLVYRRVYEWLKSWYFEQHRFNTNPSSFVDWIRRMNMTSTWRHEMQSSSVRDRYHAHFNNIFIVNYHHHNKSLQESFFCDAVVPRAVQTCHSVRKPAPPAQANAGYTLEYQRLAGAAQVKGLIGPKVDLKKAAMQVQKFHEVQQNKKLQDLPRYCLEDDLVEILFQISLKEEKVMVPEWFENEGGEVAIQESFHAFQDSGALCSVDVDKVLADEAWQRFLTDLK